MKHAHHRDTKALRRWLQILEEKSEQTGLSQEWLMVIGLSNNPACRYRSAKTIHVCRCGKPVVELYDRILGTSELLFCAACGWHVETRGSGILHGGARSCARVQVFKGDMLV